MKLHEGRIFTRQKVENRATNRCRHCKNWTFNRGRVCTGCLDGIPAPDRETAAELAKQKVNLGSRV